MNFFLFLTLFSIQAQATSGVSDVRFDFSSGKVNLTWNVSHSDLETGSITASIPSHVATDPATGLPVVTFLVTENPGSWSTVVEIDTSVVRHVSTAIEDVALMGGAPVSFTADQNFPGETSFIRTDTYSGITGETGYLIRVFPWSKGPEGWRYLKTIHATSSRILESSFLADDPLKQINQNGIRTNPSRLMRTGGFDKHANPTLRLTFKGEGIGLITYEDLETRTDQSAFRGRPVGSLRLYYKGNEVPVLVKDDGNGVWSAGDRIEVFIEPNLVNFSNKHKDLYFDPYFEGSVYFLTTESGSTGNRLGIVSGELREVISLGDSRNLIGESFRTTLHLEENNQFHGLGEIDAGEETFVRDHFFWDRVGLNQKKSFKAPVTGVDRLSQTPVKISIALHGLTFTKDLPADREHFIKVDIGDAQDGLALTERISGKERWSGQTLNIVTYQISPIDFESYMNSAGASVQIQNFDPFNPTRNIARTYAVNWIRIEYDQNYIANKNYLGFRLPSGKEPGLFQFMVENFSTPKIQLYKKGVGQLQNFVTESYIPAGDKTGTRLYRILFQDFIISPDATEFIALTEDYKISPATIQTVNPSVLTDDERPSLKDMNHDASMIIITASDFWTSVSAENPLSSVNRYSQNRENDLNERALTDPRLAGRRKQVLVTTVQDIYDEFGSGFKSPHAIREFLRYSYNNWKRKPLYVLLLGDAAQYYDSNDDLVPSMLVQTTVFGGTSSDSWYAMVSGNDVIPDMAIGRYPARTTEEINRYLDKIQGYQANTDLSGWKNQTLFISGFEDSFGDDNLEIKKVTDKTRFNTDFHVKPFFPGDPFVGGKSHLIGQFNSGMVAMNFMGHGGGGVWADAGLFEIPDVDILNPTSRLPFVTSFTCYTGEFAGAKEYYGLAEKLILAEQRGAIAVLASSGVAWKKNNVYLGRSIYQFLFDERYKNLSIGELVNLGRFYYRIHYSDFLNFPFRIPTSQIYQYGLFGDPSIQLQSPASRLVVEDENQLVSSSDSVKVSLSFPGTQTGTVQYKFADGDNHDSFSGPLSVLPLSGGSIQTKVKVPESLKGKQGILKLYGSGPATDAVGSIRFSYSKVIFTEALTTPEQIINGDPFKIQFAFEAAEQIKTGSVLLQVYDQLSDNGLIGGLSKTSSQAGGLVYFGTVVLDSVSNDLWITRDYIPGKYANTNYIYQYSVMVQDQAGKSYTFSGTLTVTTLPDVSAAPVSPGGNEENYTNPTLGLYFREGPVIGAEVYNNSDVDLQNVRVRFFGGGVQDKRPPEFLGTPLFLGETRETIERNSSKMVFIPLPADSVMEPGRPYQLSVQVFADTANGAREQSYTNNLSRPVPILFALYQFGPGKSNQVLFEDLTVSFKDAFQSDQSLNLEAVSSLPQTNQPLLKPVDEITWGGKAIRITPYSLVEPALAGMGELSVTLPEAVSLPGLSWFHFDVKSGNWLKVASTFNPDTKKFYAGISEFGLYKLFRTEDLVPPSVQISANGAGFEENLLVQPNSTFTFVIQDENGVNRKKESIRIILNGVTVPTTDLEIPDSLNNGNQFLISMSKNLALGPNTLGYRFEDASGNVIESAETQFVVTASEEVSFYGGFPNPFKRYQIFSFKLFAEAKYIQLKIYTVSGRLINSYDSRDQTNDSFIDKEGLGVSLEQGESINTDYGEIYWDGTDRNGYPVSYGVYFVKVSFKFENKTVEKVFKSVRAKVK